MRALWRFLSDERCDLSADVHFAAGNWAMVALAALAVAFGYYWSS